MSRQSLDYQSLRADLRADAAAEQVRQVSADGVTYLQSSSWTAVPIVGRSLDPSWRLRGAEDFFVRVEMSVSGCWLWLGTVQSNGYGHYRPWIGRGARHFVVLAHRQAYHALVGPIPDGLTIDHLCRVPACVNPAHLEPVTASENSRRRHAGNTHCRRGHLFDEENTRTPPSGYRQCRACERLRNGVKHRRWSTHCIRGHAYDEANTRWRTDGGRQCRTCERASRKRGVA